MPKALFTRRRKITFAIAFILALSATWIAYSVCFTTLLIPVLIGRGQKDGQGNLSIIRLPLSTSVDNRSGRIQSIFTDSRGWPISTTFLSDNTGLIPDWHWRPSSTSVLLEQVVLASNYQREIDAINRVLAPTGPRILGWIGNVFFWWILSYIGIVLTLTLARGTDIATHIPKELVQQDRAEQGLCPHCAYDIRGLDEDQLCPECGKKPSEIAVTEAKKNPIADNETDKDDTAKVSCE